MTLKYRADIDGLRAFAVLSVLIYHLNNNWLTGGFVGVDIFFVISGYLITKIIVTEVQENRFSFSAFYVRRIRRIFPALFTVLITSGFLAWFLLPTEEYKAFFQDFKFATAQVSNFRFAQDVDYMGVGTEASPLLHTWSLGVEEQFYLLWPLIIVFMARTSSKWHLKAVMVLVSILSLCLCEFFLNQGNINQAFYMFYSRAYELAIGAIIALHLIPPIEDRKKRHTLSILAGLGLISSCLFFTEEMRFPGTLALIPALSTALLIYTGSGQKKGAFNKFLAHKPFVMIGLISYSIYLWHWPFITFAQSFTNMPLNIAQSIAVSVASILFAYLTYTYIEKPFRKQQAPCWKSNAKVIAKAFFIIAFTIIIGNQFKMHQDDMGRVYSSDMFIQAFKRSANSHDHCAEGHQPTAETDLNLFTQCVLKDKKPDVLLFGDSHATYLIPTIEKWAKERSLTYLPLAAHGVRFLPVKGSSEIPHLPAYKIVEKVHPKYIFISIRYDELIDQNKHITFLEDLKHIAEEQKDSKIIIIGQAPFLKNDPRICTDKQDMVPFYKFFYKEKVTCPTRIIPFEKQDQLDAFTQRIKNELEPYNNAHVVITTDYITSLYDNKGRILYADDDHINFFGAEVLFPSLKAELTTF